MAAEAEAAAAAERLTQTEQRLQEAEASLAAAKVSAAAATTGAGNAARQLTALKEELQVGCVWYSGACPGAACICPCNQSLQQCPRSARCSLTCAAPALPPSAAHQERAERGPRAQRCAPARERRPIQAAVQGEAGGGAPGASAGRQGAGESGAVQPAAGGGAACRACRRERCVLAPAPQHHACRQPTPLLCYLPCRLG